jgi:hypothetical protein
MEASTESRQLFSELQTAHQKLTEAYVDVHRRAQLTLWRRFFTRPLVDRHIGARLGQIREAYIQATVKTFPSSAQQRWLQERVQQLELLRSTFGRRQGLRGIIELLSNVPGVLGGLGFLGITGAGAAGLQIAHICLCYLSHVVPLVLMAAILQTFVWGFYDKRKLLTSHVSDHSFSVYDAEDGVFRALGEAKPRESQLDVLGWLGAVGVMVATALVFWYGEANYLFFHPNWPVIFIVTVGLVVITTGVYSSSRNRNPI